jgi:hypothetical protein
MLSIEKSAIPVNTLLASYSMHGAYADCYCTDVPGQVSFPEYIFAFYTTPLFTLERLILKWMVSKPSTNNQARQLADGHVAKFAAWNVENRRANELVMCDFQRRTRSWLMVSPAGTTMNLQTRLYFGSAVVPSQNTGTNEPTIGFGFRALLGFHRIYSVLLLYSAALRIKSQQ